MKLKYLIAVMITSRSSEELTYVTQPRSFDEGEGSRLDIEDKGFLPYWLSCMLLNGPEDGLKPYVFPPQSRWRRVYSSL